MRRLVFDPNTNFVHGTDQIYMKISKSLSDNHVHTIQKYNQIMINFTTHVNQLSAIKCTLNDNFQQNDQQNLLLIHHVNALVQLALPV